MDKTREDQLYKLALFILGSDSYRAGHPEVLYTALERLPRDCSVRALDKLNLAAQFHELLNGADVPGGKEWMDALGPVVALHKAYFEVARQQCQRIGACLSGDDYQAIVLKGPACWGRLYAQPHIRRIKDIDLWIRDETKLLEASTRLSEAGFLCEHPNTRELIEASDTVSLNVQSMGCELEVDSATAELLQQVVAAKYRTVPIRRLSKRRYSIPLEVQIHKMPFILPDGTSPTLSDDHIASWSYAPELKIMNPYYELPYLSTKFVFDLHFVTTKCTKLLGDVVRLLQVITPEEINKSIAVSAEWKIASHYRRCLSLACELVPDIDLGGIPRESLDVIRPLITNSIVASESILTQNTVEVSGDV